MTFEDVFDAAQALPIDERRRLIDALWETTPDNEETMPSAEWIAEAGRRSAEYDAGAMLAAPWSVVRQRVDKEVGLDE